MTKHKQRDKLVTVNVPELLFLNFLVNIPRGTSPVVDKARSIVPRARGRGLTRVLRDISNEEWNDLYNIVAQLRTRIKGAAVIKAESRGSPRRDELRAALMCATVMAGRMEKLGVDNPVPYGTKKAKVAPAVTAVEDDGDDAAVQDLLQKIFSPVTLETVDDTEEVNPEELKGFGDDLKINKS